MDVGIGRVKKFSHRNDRTRPPDNNFYTCPVLLCVLFSDARARYTSIVCKWGRLIFFDRRDVRATVREEI